MNSEPDMRGGADQQRFCATWLEQRGIQDPPTLQQLMEMAEAWAAHRLRLKACRIGAEGPASPPS